MLKSAKKVSRYLIVMLNTYLLLYASVKYKYDSLYSTLDFTVNCVHTFNNSADII
jgi:hypothetical protein